MNALSILFRSDRFNLSKVGDQFINPCCFGEDLAGWLRVRLREKGIEASEPYQEDWGWELPVAHENGPYFLCLSGNSDESKANPDEGEWRVIVDRKRSIGERLRGGGKIVEDDRLTGTVEEILRAEPSIREVRREQ